MGHSNQLSHPAILQLGFFKEKYLLIPWLKELGSESSSSISEMCLQVLMRLERKAWSSETDLGKEQS